jgi:hypothetical protein
VIPKEKVRSIFETVPTKKRPGRVTERWLFRMSIETAGIF